MQIHHRLPHYSVRAQALQYTTTFSSTQPPPKHTTTFYKLHQLTTNISRVLIGVFAIIDKVKPFHQPFSLQNYTLHYPFAVKERVPVLLLCILVVGGPAVIIAFYTLVLDGLFSHQTPTPGRAGVKRLTGRYRLKDRLWELNCGILGLGLSVGAAFTITGALKNAIGKPRPDLIDRYVGL